MTVHSGLLKAAAVAVLVLSGCGGGGGGGEGDAPPAAPTYTVSGSVSGLHASGPIAGLVLRLALGGSAVDLGLATNGAFTFLPTLPLGTVYTVSVQSQPIGYVCAVSNGTGVAGSNVTDISVQCEPDYRVGGRVGGLNGVLHLQLSVDGAAPVTLRLDDDDSAVYYGAPAAMGATFAFGAGLTSGQSYVVTVSSNPSGQSCSVTDGSGVIGSGNVTSIAVSCRTTGTIPPYRSVGGTVSGLAGPLALAMAVDGDSFAAPFVVLGNTFTLPHRVRTGQAYAVSIHSEPSGQDCSVLNASGLMGSADIANVSVVCASTGAGPVRYAIGGVVTGLTSPILLRLSAGATSEDLTIIGNGPFNFTSALTSGEAYSITLPLQPVLQSGQYCTVSNASGVIGSANVPDASVGCVFRYVATASGGG
jgi:hypothetical protein